MQMTGKKIERRVEKGIVVGRLMRNSDIKTEATVQEGVGNVPMVVTKIPRGILAAPNHHRRPAEHDRRKIRAFCRREPEAPCEGGWRVHGDRMFRRVKIDSIDIRL